VTSSHEHLTPKQHEELKAELAALEARRPGIVQAIKVAREFGDLSENFDELELRVAQLEHRLRLAEAAQDLRPL
jgi:transcription elongation GreA/GreB family factor